MWGRRSRLWIITVPLQQTLSEETKLCQILKIINCRSNVVMVFYIISPQTRTTVTNSELNLHIPCCWKNWAGFGGSQSSPFLRVLLKNMVLKYPSIDSKAIACLSAWLNSKHSPVMNVLKLWRVISGSHTIAVPKKYLYFYSNTLTSQKQKKNPPVEKDYAKSAEGQGRMIFNIVFEMYKTQFMLFQLGSIQRNQLKI